MFVKLSLYALVAFGFWGSGRLAWRELTTGEACPVVGSVPACYVAFAGYLAMVIGLAFVKRNSWARKSFYAGVLIAGGLALVGSTMELVQGNVCPRVGEVPMCYLSFGMSLWIAAAFVVTTRKQNQPETGTAE